MSGPHTVPTAQVKLINPNHFGRSFKGTNSAVITYVSVIIAPAPMPWTQRPPSKVGKFGDTAHIMEPIIKNVTALSIKEIRPKLVDNDVKGG
jgi:hypothetical protein